MSTTITLRCDWPGCTAWANTTAATDNGARTQLEPLGWFDLGKFGDRDYCPTHADGAQANRDDIKAGR